ncbi:MAG: PAS domain S-box protein [Gemmatimonadaceae bacterium]|nr:PAS domain S-box protein [Gemmatimonadaceae bacterium]
MHTPTHSDAALAAIVDISSDAIIALDNQYKIIRFNRGAEDTFGWTEAEMLGQPLDRLLPAGIRAVHDHHVRRFAEGAVASRRMAQRAEISGLRRTGEGFPAEASIARVTIDGVQTFMVTLRDVSERRRVEERQRLMAAAGWVLAASLDIDSTMATVAELPLPLVGDWSLLELVTADGRIRRVASAHADAAHTALTAALVSRAAVESSDNPPTTSGGRAAHEVEAQRISDTKAWIEANFPDPLDRERVETLGASAVLMVPLRAGGRAIGVLHVVRAKSGAMHLPEDAQLADQYAGLAALALENARLYHEARQAVRERDDMLAVVSHDLRNPVNAIVLLTGAVLSGDHEGGALMNRDDVESIRSAARQANDLIQDLQDVSRISTGRLRVEQRPVSIEEVVDDAADMFEPAMRDAGITFAVQVAPGIDPLPADRGRLLQVLSNLLGNAVRFTPRGGDVTLSLERGESAVRIAVRDTGPGVAPDDVPRLFERYWQAPRLLRAGSGLGLFISKGIVEAHGGEIGVVSNVGQGSEFWFTVPVP